MKHLKIILSLLIAAIFLASCNKELKPSKYDQARDKELAAQKEKEKEAAKTETETTEEPAKPNTPQEGIKASGKHQNHEYVDLGLPSGTMWARTNIDADKPEGYGNYFAWGEIKEKNNYNWAEYTDLDPKKQISTPNPNGEDFTKYFVPDGDFIENDDVAKARWQGKWRVPSKADFEELLANCYLQWTNGYNGTSIKGFIFYKVKSDDHKGQSNTAYDNTYRETQDRHIFLPAAGTRAGDNRQFDEKVGYYWSKTLGPAMDLTSAWHLTFSASKPKVDKGGRYKGLPVRAIYKP